MDVVGSDAQAAETEMVDKVRSPNGPEPGHEDVSLIAYRLAPGANLKLVPAPSMRSWIAGTRHRFAARCLPLLIANQAGWFILNEATVRVTWDGGPGTTSLHIEYPDGWTRYSPKSHFGHGILTWNLPYLFRTSPGYNLLARGPANYPKDGVYPLEGIVETDWSPATFTMNWMLTRADSPVVFEVDEPICMLVPQQRGNLERVKPFIYDIRDNPDLHQGYDGWLESRTRFLQDLRLPGSEAAKQGWERHYFHGTSPTGISADEHQVKLRLRDFEEVGDGGSEAGRQ